MTTIYLPGKHRNALTTIRTLMPAIFKEYRTVILTHIIVEMLATLEYYNKSLYLNDRTNIGTVLNLLC